MKQQPHHFSLGRINVSLRSDCRSFVDEYRSLYESYRRDSAGDDAIEIRIEARHRYPWRRGPFLIHSDGAMGFEVRHRYEVLPHLEWIINWQIIKQRTDYVQLHASTLTSPTDLGGLPMGALLLPGDPGAGKTTLTAGLLTRGWSYLCDEFALIDPRTREAHPYPRALCIKQPSFAVIDGLGLPVCRKTPYHKPTKGRVAFLNPLDIRSDIVGAPSRIRWVVFPKYVVGATPALEPISRSQAAFELLRQCFNFKAYRGRALDILTDVVRDAACFHLTSGEIHATCDLIQNLVGKTRDAQRACA